ncbi:hypothetical protein BT96DRAFT_840966 [Gymnopus androsaceus JB14]|uniref:Uncharacterized protein n=1 Tax=Gymnopus androsaceus JB14 TaxID=1447944 RepID=A0A6A4GJ06_9AGAR|nr:hypothetical protein BT96DRAFT_840966 [Gymnopus androsaceus JB14]
MPGLTYSKTSKKYQRRLKIAGAMLDVSRTNDDQSGIEFWSFVLRAVTGLTSDGMSDEENGDGDGDETARRVLDIDFRHPDFRELFKKVDNVRKSHPRIFNQAGAKYKRRLHVDTMSQRQPPPHLPKSFYRPEYLSKISNGNVPEVTFGTAEYALSRYLLLCLCGHFS